jgi:hypothetical protein
MILVYRAENPRKGLYYIFIEYKYYIDKKYYIIDKNKLHSNVALVLVISNDKYLFGDIILYKWMICYNFIRYCILRGLKHILLSQHICLFLRARVLTERTDLCSLFARRRRTQGYTGLARSIYQIQKVY